MFVMDYTIRNKVPERATWALFVALLFLVPQSWAGQPKASGALGALSDGLENITANVLRCVVRITGETYVPEQDNSNDKAQLNSNPATASEVEGSGIVISADGYIVTNAHVVAGEHRLRVFVYHTDSDIEELTAKVVGIDQVTDLAVLKIQSHDLRFIDLEEAVQAKQGEISLAFGDPYGMDRSVTLGIVSAVNRQMEPDDPRIWYRPTPR